MLRTQDEDYDEDPLIKVSGGGSSSGEGEGDQVRISTFLQEWIINTKFKPVSI